MTWCYIIARMDNRTLDQLLRRLDSEIEGQEGYWQITLKQARIICLTDEKNNRMRFIAPIRETADMDVVDLTRCLEANFHTALDIKYAISDGVLWSTFMHPLRELSEDQAKDALQQVYNGTLTYGTTYASSYLTFPGPEDRKNKIH